MLTAQECRERAAQSLREAETVADPNARTTLQWFAKEWTSLAEHVERHASFRPLSPPPMKRPADLQARPYLVDAADILRQRLRLAQTEDEPSEPTSDTKTVT